jgi:hypothetical protein
MWTVAASFVPKEGVPPVALALTLLLLAPLQPAGEPSLEQLLEKHAELRKATTDAQNAEAVSLAAIKARYKEITDKINRLLPNPGPGPGPDPVKPPEDPLAAKLREAFGKSEASDAHALAALYRECAKLCRDPELDSTMDLLTRLQDASKRMVGATVLLPVRKVVQSELAATLGVPSDDPITDTHRNAAASLFVRLATILEGF